MIIAEVSYTYLTTHTRLTLDTLGLGAEGGIMPIEMKFWKALRNTEIFFNVLLTVDVWKRQPVFKHQQIDINIVQSWYKPLSGVKHEISLIHKYKVAKVFISGSDWQAEIMQMWLR